MKTTTLDPNIIGQKFYTIANNRIMAEKVTKVTFKYSTWCGSYWTEHQPILHLKRADGAEVEVRLTYDYDEGKFRGKRPAFYENPDDATEDKEMYFTFPDIKALAEERRFGVVETDKDWPSTNVDERAGRHHCQRLARYRWDGAKPIESCHSLFIIEINKEGFEFGLGEKHGDVPVLLIPEDDKEPRVYSPERPAKIWENRDADKLLAWWETTYPTKVSCINANKIEVIDFDD